MHRSRMTRRNSPRHSAAGWPPSPSGWRPVARPETAHALSAALRLASWLALIALTVLWDMAGSPPKAPPGFWLAVKALPLLLPLFGLLRGRARAYVWASLLALLYLTEGLVLAWSERAGGLRLDSPWPYALLEAALSALFVVTAAYCARGRLGIARS
ncbi:MAG: DUF2069 domain-containing protein [Comamonadaceae bacterium]|nr:DUF2069 domain-containing protein [Comamonadaceae bacterium]